MASFFKKPSASEAGMVGWIQGGSFLVIALVVAFGDAMFVKLMWSAFPDGFLRYLAIGGAFTTALSIILLVLGKERWFRPGQQLQAAIFFTGVEVVVSIFNVLCAAGVGMMFWWLSLAPATPFLSVIGWIVIRMLDPATKIRHAQMEMEDEIQQSELDFTKAQHDAQMLIRQKALEYSTQYMIQALENPEHQKTIEAGADKLTGRTIETLLGMRLPAAPPTGQSVSLAQNAQVPPQPNP